MSHDHKIHETTEQQQAKTSILGLESAAALHPPHPTQACCYNLSDPVSHFVKGSAGMRM